LDEGELREQIVVGCQILSRRGLVEGFGHLSARLDDGSLLITPRKPLLLVERDDIVRLDSTGQQVGGSAQSPLEANMHLVAYRRRPEIRAIARTHSFMTSAFAAAGQSIRPVHGLGANLGEEVPVYADIGLVSNDLLAEQVVATLGHHEAMLLRGNGTLVVAPSLREAVMRAIWLEESATIEWRIRAMGAKPIWLTGEEVDARRSIEPSDAVRAWDYEVAMLSRGWQ
jgi:ribulose-5-phosphate 4-epimerase/fuculose-1-phosphate aldolase